MARLDHVWEERLKQLIEFKEKTGHFNVPNTEEHTKLLFWTYTQRKAKTAGVLRRDRFKKLNAIGFEWKSSRLMESRWDTQYALLEQFYKEWGHTNVTPKDLQLSTWCARQRTQRQNGVMPKERIDKLNKLKFVWKLSEEKNPPKKMKQRDNFYTESLWESNYNDLVNYKAQFGNCHVSLTYNIPFAKWVSRQRTLRARGTLQESRVKKLDQLGFDWKLDTIPQLEEQWECMYQRLVEFKEKHGHCNVASTYKEGDSTSLACWVTTQRQFAHRRPDRKEKLDKLGFLWSYPIGPRKRKLEKLEEDEEDDDDYSVFDDENSSKSTHASQLSKALPGIRAGQSNKTRQEILASDAKQDEKEFQVLDDSPYPVGTRLINFFPGYGWYRGTIKVVNKNTYKVVYDDGDQEEFRIKDAGIDALVELAKSHPDIGEVDHTTDFVAGNRKNFGSNNGMAARSAATNEDAANADQDKSGIQFARTSDTLRREDIAMKEESKAEKEKLLIEFKIREQEWGEKLIECVASFKTTCDDLESQVKRSHEALSAAKAELKKMETAVRRKERQCHDKDLRIATLTGKVEQLEKSQFVVGSVGEKVLSRLQGKMKQK